MIATVSINGTDLWQLGFAVRDIRNVWDLPQYSKDSTSIPGRPGQVVPQTITTKISPRTIDIIGTLMGTSRSDFLLKLDKLKALITATPLTVILAEQPTRYFTARPLGSAMNATGPVLLQKSQEFTLSLIADDPFAYDVTAQTVAFTAATPIPLGNMPSGGIITITGGTNPVITYKNSAAVTIKTMTFTGTGTPLIIDLDQFLASVAGVSVINLLTAGSFIQLSPLDGNFLTSSWPTLQVSSGSGSITYRRAYA